MHVYSLQAALTFWVWDSCSLSRAMTASIPFCYCHSRVTRAIGEFRDDFQVVARVDKDKGGRRNAQLRRRYTDKRSGGRRLPPLVNSRHKAYRPPLCWPPPSCWPPPCLSRSSSLPRSRCWPPPPCLPRSSCWPPPCWPPPCWPPPCWPPPGLPPCCSAAVGLIGSFGLRCVSMVPFFIVLIELADWSFALRDWTFSFF
jgi:hypothetical protein